MKKRFNIFYLVAVLDIIMAVIRFVEDDMLIGFMWICSGILMFLVGGLDFGKGKKNKDETKEEE